MSKTRQPQRIPVRIHRLESGYWHVRFSANQFLQWPIGRPWADVRDEGFGWLTSDHYRAALDAVKQLEAIANG